MATAFRCTVLTPERVAFEGQVEGAFLPAHDGEIGILPGHADFLGMLGQGAARLKVAGADRILALNGGYLRVSGGALTVLAEEAQPKEALSRDEAEQALQAALAERPRTPAEADARDARLGWARARLRAIA